MTRLPASSPVHALRASCVLINSMELCRTGSNRNGSSPAIGLLVLSVLWAIAWLLPDLFPHFDANALSLAQTQAILFFVFALIAALIARARHLNFPRGPRAWTCAGIGVGLFVIPAVLTSFAQGLVSRLDQVAVLSMTPVFAVVLEPYLQDSPPRQGKAALAGALAAVAGILFLFPLDIPGSFRAGAALCGLLAASLGVAITNCLAVSLAREAGIRSSLPIAALAGAASAFCFAVGVVFSPHPAWRWSALPAELLALLLIDLPALFLLFWLMRHLAASRMTARFLLAPLFTILGGIALQPSMPPSRAWLGLALLAAGAGWLAFAPADSTDAIKLN